MLGRDRERRGVWSTSLVNRAGAALKLPAASRNASRRHLYAQLPAESRRGRDGRAMVAARPPQVRRRAADHDDVGEIEAAHRLAEVEGHVERLAHRPGDASPIATVGGAASTANSSRSDAALPLPAASATAPAATPTVTTPL